MRYFPIFLDSSQQCYLIIGSNEKSQSKLSLLSQTEARLRVIFDSSIFDMKANLSLEHERIQWEDRRDTWVEEGDLNGIDMVYCGLDMLDQMQSIQQLCHKRHILFNAIDMPEHCDFITPAIVDREPIQVAISTAGAAPMLGKAIKAHLEVFLEDQLGDFIKEIGVYRKACLVQMKQLGYSDFQRRAYWEHILVTHRHAFIELRGEALRLALLEQLQGKCLSRTSQVYLIGTGPYALKYLTQQAIDIISRADVILMDRLINRDILKKWARKECQVIDVGKKAGCEQSTTQEYINQLLVKVCLDEEGKQNGKIVVRLKGGDPMIFGRASEELFALQQAKLEVEVIPGISAAIAGAAQYQIPITARGIFRKFSVLTAQSAEGFVEHDWQALKQDAFAIYMGSHVLLMLIDRLFKADFPLDTPICIIKEISSPTEQCYVTTLKDLSKLQAALGKATMIIYVNVQPLKESALSTVFELEKMII